MFIEFICRYTDVEKIEDITKGIANTHFHKWYRRKVWNSTTPAELKSGIIKFFTFLAQEKGIKNQNVLGAKKTRRPTRESS